MVDNSLLNYIKDSLERGFREDYIKQTLIDQGWNSQDINDAFNQVHGYGRDQPHPHEEHPHAPPQHQEQSTPENTNKTTTQTEPTQQQIPSKRTTGITVISSLGILSAVMALLLGAISLGVGAFIGIGSDILPMGPENITAPAGVEGIGFLLNIMGFVYIIIGVVGLVGFYLLLKMKKIGWIIIILIGFLQVASFLMSFLSSFNILEIIYNTPVIVLWIVIIVYLYMKRKLFV